jgi:hypothetical protein
MEVETYLTKEFLIFFAIFLLIARYALRFLDQLADKWFKNTTKDHNDVVTYAHCKLHRDSCMALRREDDHRWKRDLTAMKQVIFRIGRKLEIEDAVLERLVGDGEE